MENQGYNVDEMQNINRSAIQLIRSHIGSIRNCGVVLKIEEFSHLSSRSFGLDSPIGLGYLSLMLSLRAGA